MMNATVKKRFIAASWFAIAALAPAMAVYLTFTQYTWASFGLFLALPIVLAGVCGFLMGALLLTEGGIRNGWTAALYGLGIAMTSYLALCLAFFIIATVLYGDPGAFAEAPILVALLGSLGPGGPTWETPSALRNTGYPAFEAAAAW